MSDYDVIVIGAGPNGLTTGAYMAKAGADVLVIEKRREAGGGLASESEGGFTYQPHATYHMMADLMPPYHDLNLSQWGIDFYKPDPRVVLHTKDGPLTAYGEPEKTGESIANFSEEDAESFKDLFRDSKEAFDEVILPATYEPPVPPGDQTMMLKDSAAGERVLEWSEMSYLEIIDSYDIGEPTRALLLYLSTMWGIDPKTTGIGFMFPLYLVRMIECSGLVGGSHRLNTALHSVIYQNGGRVVDGKIAKDIVIEDGEAKGVKIEDPVKGEEEYPAPHSARPGIWVEEGKEEAETITADAIVSTLNPEQTFLTLIGEENLPDYLHDRVKSWEWEEQSLFNFHIGLRNPPEYECGGEKSEINKALLQIMGVDTSDDILAGYEELKENKYTDHGHATCYTRYSPNTAPVRNGNQFHIARWETLAPYELQGDPENWDQMKEEIAGEYMDLWSNYASNIDHLGGKLFFTTPLGIERRFSTMKRGSFKHGEYESLQMGVNRPHVDCSDTTTPIDGLFVAGASVYPGGMITLAPGYIAAGKVCEYLGAEKWWEPPECVLEAREKGFLP
ncbi:hypothetical protein AKJ61_01345 [candidate division MSBL1 archaeon SCGC-AAA259B11]|uniref:Amine oxidase domain-containing protein n=1 Tax=candidate division MSBL1 archaeon SCGC-AAA259B11 TaxID=1698260 RepID=A0A133U7J7_9EURY|nr:hypothetical protein AKJ61_01345 [candidate division MSBL1 archaeon SCGC-AAA259B11]